MLVADAYISLFFNSGSSNSLTPLQSGSVSPPVAGDAFPDENDPNGSAESEVDATTAGELHSPAVQEGLNQHSQSALVLHRIQTPVTFAAEAHDQAGENS